MNLILGSNPVSDEQFLYFEEILPILEQLRDETISPEEKRDLRHNLCQRKNITQRTLRGYLKKFREGGLKALVRKTRSDAGINRLWDPRLIAKAIALYDENPYRSLKQIHSFLKNDETISNCAKLISTSCLYQRMKKAGVDFQEIKSQKGARTYRSFEALFANELWQSDARHGIFLSDPKNPRKKRRCYLFCWLDDHSRLILFARYYFDEKLPTMEDSFRQAALRYGLPDKVYLDNGSAYIGKQFALHLSELEVRKIHHPPYQAWCKGKVESVMKPFKKFQREAELAGCKTLEEINSALAAWIEIEHNRKIHSSTGETPIERYKKSIDKRPARIVNDLQKFEEVFLWRSNRVVDKLGKISVYNNEYRVPEIAHGTSIEIRFNPFHLEEIFLYENGKYHSTLRTKVLARSRAPFIPEEKKISDYKVSKAAADYMSRLRKQHAENIELEASQVLYRNIKKTKLNEE